MSKVSIAPITPDRVTEALRGVVYPGLARDLVSFGMLQHVSVCDGRVKAQLALSTQDETIPARLEAAIADALQPLGAVSVAWPALDVLVVDLPSGTGDVPLSLGAGALVAGELGASLLADVPFDSTIVGEGDAGIPTVIARPDSAATKAFDLIAIAVANQLGWRWA